MSGPQVEQRVAGNRRGVDRVHPAGVGQHAPRSIGSGQRRKLAGVEVGVVARKIAVRANAPGVHHAGRPHLHIGDGQRPVATRELAPVAGRRESEVDVPLRRRRVLHEHALGTIRRRQRHAQLHEVRVRQSEVDLDAIDAQTRSERDRARGAAAVRDGNRRCRVLQALGNPLVERGGDAAPALGDTHRRIGIDQAEAVIVADVHAATVPVIRGVERPARRTTGAHRRRRQDLLHVAPAEAGIGVEQERGNPADHRRRERGSVQRRVVAARVTRAIDPVGRRDAVAGCSDQQRRAGRRVIGDVAAAVGRGDGDRAAVVLEAVVIDVLA